MSGGNRDARTSVAAYSYYTCPRSPSGTNARLQKRTPKQGEQEQPGPTAPVCLGRLLLASPQRLPCKARKGDVSVPTLGQGYLPCSRGTETDIGTKLPVRKETSSSASVDRRHGRAAGVRATRRAPPSSFSHGASLGRGEPPAPHGLTRGSHTLHSSHHPSHRKLERGRVRAANASPQLWPR